MRRKEIYFKQLSFVIGFILIVYFVLGAEIPLPLRSEIRFVQGSNGVGAIRSEFIIQQEENKINIVFFKDLNKWIGIIREGVISVSEFKTFWDSLVAFNFWQLNEGYDELKKEGEIIVTCGGTEGSISVSYEKKGGDKITKIIRYREPQSCPVEFQRIYGLLVKMDRFAKNTPDLRRILKYGELGYQKYANSEIGSIKDSNYLDTLLILLSSEKKYTDGIIQALGNIGGRRADSVLHQYLEQLEKGESSWDRDGIILVTLQSLVSIEGSKSVETLKGYLNRKYRPWLIEKVSEKLFKLNDYSAIPILIELLQNGDRYGAAHTLRKAGLKDKKVISSLVIALEDEENKKELNDEIIDAIILALTELTGENYPYKSYDSLEAKKETINKWINWWKENKDNYK